MTYLSLIRHALNLTPPGHPFNCVFDKGYIMILNKHSIPKVRRSGIYGGTWTWQTSWTAAGGLPECRHAAGSLTWMVVH